MALTDTTTVPAKVRPRDPRTPGYDPHKGWDKLTRQIGVVTPARIERVRRVRESLLPILKV